MVFLISVLIGTQILCSLAGYPPFQEPPSSPGLLMSPPCNSSSVKAVADLALDKLNEDRRTGYVLGLQRIFYAYELEWQETGLVYYLTLDVLETECHVLSRKPWKDCGFRPAHESVYGQCKVTFYINKPWRILHLFNYDCILQPIPAAAFLRTCPDCPVPGNPTEPRYLEAAILSLAKFNAENNHIHYFKLRNVTRARSQWVVGPSYFVSYVIQETSCSKSQALEDLSNCSFLPDETADVGVCKGSVTNSQIEHRKFISADCEIFHPQVNGGQQTGNRKPGQQNGEESHEDDGHSKGGRKGHHDGHSEGRREGHHDGHSEGRREGHHDGHSEGRREGQHDGHSEGRREGHHDGHSEGRREGHHDGNSAGRRKGHRGHHHHPHDRHHHKHHRHHKNDSLDQEPGQDHPTSDVSETSPHLEKTVGRVVVLPLSDTHVSLHSLPDIEAERLDGVPVPPRSQGPKPNPHLPDIHGAPDESRPLGKPTGHPDMAKPVSPVVPPPFPPGFAQLETCPGEILVNIHGLEPLLPKMPAKLSPTEIPYYQAKEKVKH
ncbi:fetuin-B-like isoform X2 [Heteronotia binoei]|uniref:fetuin-B-like isoform X2 n=1 Tax=Heteronotia binoei TaxID=13085 RepID=UPI00292D7641|nr:fetuin-B-like isoform X2 [Heteronotia binoei]